MMIGETEQTLTMVMMKHGINSRIKKIIKWNASNGVPINQYLGIMEELFNGKSKESVSNRK